MRIRLILSVLGALTLLTGAQVRVNEFSAANTLAHPDVVDFEDYPDWIELKNTTGGEVSLAGYFLSDDPGKPFKWPFSSGTTIPADGFLVVWADGHDAVPGDVRPRGYWPWRNFTVEGHHTNFSLSADGESVVLTRAFGLANTELITAASPAPVLPATAAVWKYLDDGSNQSTQWRARSFDDSSWASGPSKLGYGDSGMATTVSYGASSSNKHITTYFRHSFQVVDPGGIASLSLRLLVDDGAVIYLNGSEVVRKNLPAGEISHLTGASLAVGGSGETSFTNFNISASNLVAGENVLAVEVHQVSGNSSDLSFDLGLTAVTFTSSSQLDEVTFGPQLDAISRGRNPASESDWVTFGMPSPGGENDEGAIVPELPVTGVEATVSLESGFYSSEQSVLLGAASGDIHYTLDGGLPNQSSPVYSLAIPISSTTVLRARVFDTGRPPGPVETRTYFFGETQGTVPFVSVVADPDALFGDEIGIYHNMHEPYVSGSSGLRDVYKGKDAPGSLEYFAPAGAPGFRVNGGYRMGGENNWGTHEQRAMNFALRGKYGDDAISYDVFPGSGIGLHTGLALREGGDNWRRAMLADGMWPFIAKGRLTADTADYRPSVVFINGDYWGIYNLRSRWDDIWFFENKRISDGEVDHLLYGHVDSSSTSLGIEKGDADDWLDLVAFLNANDMSQPENYAFVEARIDIDSFIDFVVAESYSQNTSWRHNREFWKERRPGSKWHWFLPDMDRTFRTGQLNSGVLADMLGDDEVLRRLKGNAGFVERLAQRFSAHVGSTFKPSRIHGIIDQMASEVDGEVTRHIERWAADGAMSASSRTSTIQEIKDFADARDAAVHAELQAGFGLPAPVELTLAMNIPTAGELLVSGVPVDVGMLRMFPGIGFDLEARAAPGFEFVGWNGVEGGASTSLVLTGVATVTANFAVSGETVVGGSLAGDTTFNAAGSPYALDGDLIVPPGVTLTIGPDVELRMPEGRNLRVQGALQVQGTPAEPVSISGRNGELWGGLSFEEPTGASALAHVIIRDATHGHDPIRHPSAISGFNATLVMEFIDIDESEGPVFCRGGSTILRDSRLHTPITGDCINVKGGYAEVINCVFTGNNAPDTDAVDYDGVVGGVIRGNRIYRFQGSNSDAVDIGEGCSGLVIERNLIYYCSDKGFSVGQGSEVTIRRNLVVGCALGVGVKDRGSFATIDQNTFVNCIHGVDVYEKNFGNGGGDAVVENCIFSNCEVATVTADALSSVTVDFCLSDTSELVGSDNLLADPLFVDPAALNFQLHAASPAIDAGDPAHADDPDSSQADIGALYVYSAADYPFIIGNTIVVEEVLANSEGAGDWIELRNRSASAVDIGGWFLSDSGANMAKYRIPAGTVVPAGGQVVFFEDIHFGASSIDPGRITPFALSDAGETVFVSSAVADEITDYQSKESFGPSLAGESIGNYYKPSSGSWNFVALRIPTPGSPNSGPRIGPVVISEIHYDPEGGGASEYFELCNVSGAPVQLYDDLKGAAWRLTDGIDFEFPASPPLVMAPGERIILTRNLAEFDSAFSPPPGTPVFEWASGKLADEGERLQLGRPAGVDALNIRQFARVDRVNYGPAAPWPAAAAGGGSSLSKIAEHEYGNDFANWRAAATNPGESAPGPSFAMWSGGFGLPVADRDAEDDPDFDGRSNLVEYLLGSSPVLFDAGPPLQMTMENGHLLLGYGIRDDRPGARAWIETSSTLAPGSWLMLDSAASGYAGGFQQRAAELDMTAGSKGFVRLNVEETAP